MRNRLLVLIFLGLMTQKMSAQNNQFTLEEIWEQAVQFNKENKLKKTDVQLGEQVVKDAKTAQLPHVYLGGTYARISDMPLYEHGLWQKPEVIPVISTSYKAELEASMPIYNGGQISREIKIKKLHLATLEEIQQMSLADIKVKSMKFFYELIRNQDFKQLVAKEISQDNKLLADISSLYRNGTVLKSDVLRAELKLSNHQMLATEIQNNITLTIQQLNIIMGREDDLDIIPVEADELLTTLEDLSYEAYVEMGIENAYELKIGTDEIKVKELEIKQVKAALLPRISFFTGYSYSYPQFTFYPYADAIYGIGQIGLKLNIPLSNIYLTKPKKAIAKLSRDNQVTLQEIKKDALRKDIKANYLHFAEALEHIEVANKSIVQATEALRILNSSYFNQQSLLTDLLNAETQLLQAKFDLSTAQVSAHILYYQLQRLVGKI